MAITYRGVKGSALSYVEMDRNFEELFDASNTVTLAFPILNGATEDEIVWSIVTTIPATLPSGAAGSRATGPDSFSGSFTLLLNDVSVGKINIAAGVGSFAIPAAVVQNAGDELTLTADGDYDFRKVNVALTSLKQ